MSVVLRVRWRGVASVGAEDGPGQGPGDEPSVTEVKGMFLLDPVTGALGHSTIEVQLVRGIRN